MKKISLLTAILLVLSSCGGKKAVVPPPVISPPPIGSPLPQYAILGKWKLYHEGPGIIFNQSWNITHDTFTITLQCTYQWVSAIVSGSANIRLNENTIVLLENIQKSVYVPMPSDPTEKVPCTIDLNAGSLSYSVNGNSLQIDDPSFPDPWERY